MDQMANGDPLDILTAPQRNNYFYGKLMDVLHFQMEQKYGNRKRWLLNRLGLGEGVLCGLEITSQKNQLCVSPGVAIDALGREIIVPATTCVNPWQLTDSCGHASGQLTTTESHEIYLCLAYKECTAEFMPVLVTECNTREHCAPGTIVETFYLLVQEGTPIPIPDPSACATLRNGTTSAQRRQLLSLALSGSCPSRSGAVCVPLAAVQLNSDGKNGMIGAIDQRTYRPAIYSNAVLLDLILCLAARIEECCGRSPYSYRYSGLPAIGAHLI